MTSANMSNTLSPFCFGSSKCVEPALDNLENYTLIVFF